MIVTNHSLPKREGRRKELKGWLQLKVVSPHINQAGKPNMHLPIQNQKEKSGLGKGRGHKGKEKEEEEIQMRRG